MDGEHVGATAGRGDTSNANSAATDKTGAGGRHGTRTAARARVAGRQENPVDEPYGVVGGGEGREAYGVAINPLGLGGNGGSREAYGVVEKPGGGPPGSGRGDQVAAGH